MEKEKDAQDIDEAELTARLLRSAGPRIRPDVDRTARVLTAVREDWQKSVAARAPLVNRWWSLAAALAIAIIGGAILWNQPRLARVQAATLQMATGEVVAGSRPLAVGGVVQTGAAIRTSTGRAAFLLASGASCRLDTDTTVRFLEPNRIELVRGALYFDSRSEGRSPGSAVEIVTDQGVVRDIGTQFEVRVGNDLRVRVREGRVEMERGRRSYEAVAGAEIRVTPSGELLRSSVAPDDPSWKWILNVAPAFRLEGESLGEFLRWTCRELGCEVRYALPTPASAVILHGSIEGLTPDQALPAVLRTTGMTSRREDRFLIVEASR